MKRITTSASAAVLATACMGSRQPTFHAREPTTQSLASQVVPALLHRTETMLARMMANRARCDVLSPKWPAVMLDPAPGPDEQFCFALDQPWPIEAIAQDPATAKALVEDMRLFACAFTVAPGMYTRAASTPDPLTQRMYDDCRGRAAVLAWPSAGGALTVLQKWLPWSLTYNFASDVIEYEIQASAAKATP